MVVELVVGPMVESSKEAREGGMVGKWPVGCAVGGLAGWDPAGGWHVLLSEPHLGGLVRCKST